MLLPQACSSWKLLNHCMPYKKYNSKLYKHEHLAEACLPPDKKSNVKLFKRQHCEMIPWPLIRSFLRSSHSFRSLYLSLSVRGGWFKLITLWVTCSVIAIIDLGSASRQPLLVCVCVVFVLSGNSKGVARTAVLYPKKQDRNNRPYLKKFKKCYKIWE